MELKNLLSVVIAVLTALGAMLFAMGSQSPWLAMALWMAAVVSLVVTDFLGAVRVPRNLASLLMWGVLAIFLPHFAVQSNWDNRLQSVAAILICLQMTLLFQEKDPRVYGWLAVMSLLQAVVAARYSQGVVFGGVLIAYTIVGIFALSLLVLYGQWVRHRGAAEGRDSALVGRTSESVPKTWTDSEVHPTSARWPLAAAPTQFTSAPAGSGRSGVVAELFARLALIGLGVLFLAAVIFSTTPRFRLSAWRGDARKAVATVGFNDQITLGGLGETIENHQEVMQLKLLDKATREVYPLHDDAVYLRGSMVTWYSQNHWRRIPPSEPTVGNALRGVPDKARSDPSGNATEGVPYSRDTRPGSVQGRAVAGKMRDDTEFRIGPPVVQQITMEPYLEPHDDLFYVWPLVEPVGEYRSPRIEIVDGSMLYDTTNGRLMRMHSFSSAAHDDNFKFELVTSGLVDGRQAPLVPASEEVRVLPYLQMPDDRSPLPRLRALAARWLRESGLPPDRHYDIARYFEQQLSGSGQFRYTLQGAERDTSIDAMEDFVSNHPCGHCEYFATALAMMLRSVGIPSRVVLGYRCDEWHEEQQCYQVRQLHAHAWVEAFLEKDQVPEWAKRGQSSFAGTAHPNDESRMTNDEGRALSSFVIRHSSFPHGGWLRLDPTPAGEVGTQAAERTMWGAWQGRWHGLERYWDKYIVDMDRIKQRESVYEPIFRATRKLTGKFFDSQWWRGVAASLWASLAAMLRSGMMGWLYGVLVLMAMVIVPVTVAWWLVRRVRRLWRRFFGTGGRRPAEARSSIEFYRRFEQIVACLGLRRACGQTPREFASAAGTRLAAVSGRRELCARALQVVEVFYRVRFGRQVLDASAAQAVEQALEELTAGSHPPPK